MWRAAVDAGWDVERLQSYAVPEALAGRDLVRGIWVKSFREDATSFQGGAALVTGAASVQVTH
jgi:hypothetical protein